MHVLDGSPDRPMQRGHFLGGKHARACTTLLRAVQKWLNRSKCHLGCGLRWAQGSMCYMGVHIGATWRIRLNCPYVRRRHGTSIVASVVNDRLLTFVETTAVTQRVARFIYATAETCIFYDSPRRKQFECISAHNMRSVTVMRPPASSILYEMARIMQESTPGTAVIRYVVYPRDDIARPSCHSPSTSTRNSAIADNDVNKDWTHKVKDKDLPTRTRIRTRT